jgi:hypothetical protein
MVRGVSARERLERDQPRADQARRRRRRHRVPAVDLRRAARARRHRLLAAVHGQPDGDGVAADERVGHDHVRLRLRAGDRLDVRRGAAVHLRGRAGGDARSVGYSLAGQRNTAARARVGGAGFDAGGGLSDRPRRVVVNLGADPPVRGGCGVLLCADRGGAGRQAADRGGLPREVPEVVVRQRSGYLGGAGVVHDQPLRSDAGDAAGAERVVPANAVRVRAGPTRAADPPAPAVPAAEPAGPRPPSPRCGRSPTRCPGCRPGWRRSARLRSSTGPGVWPTVPSRG